MIVIAQTAPNMILTTTTATAIDDIDDDDGGGCDGGERLPTVLIFVQEHVIFVLVHGYSYRNIKLFIIPVVVFPVVVFKTKVLIPSWP